MKRSLLTIAALLTGTLTLGLTAVSKAQVQPDFAQSMLSGILNRSCHRATEVSYRSNQIATASTGGTQLHVEAVLRKIVEPNSPLRQSDRENRCLPDARQTSAHELVIQRPNEIRRIQLTPHNSGYLVYHLQSFSQNGQYLVVDLQTIYASGDSDNFVTIFDLTGSNLAVRTADVCRDLDTASFFGFSGPTEIIVRCEGFLGRSEAYRTVNIETGAARAIEEVPDVFIYGVQASEPAVTKIQHFQ